MRRTGEYELSTTTNHRPLGGMEVDEEEEDDDHVHDRHVPTNIIVHPRTSLLALVKKHPIKFAVGAGLLMAIVFVINIVCYVLAVTPNCKDVLGKEYFSILPTSSLGNSNHNKTSYHVLLLGDSLIEYPFARYNLGGKIQSYLPQYKLLFYMAGVGGDFVSRQLARLDSVLDAASNVQPIDFVLLLSDSDASDINWFFKTESVRQHYQTQYIWDMTSILSRIKQRIPNVSIGLAGPVLMGEGPLYNINPINKLASWHGEYLAKRKVYDQYRDVNIGIAAAFTIPYLDIRQRFLDHIPKKRLGFRNCLTDDGEHENERGTYIVAKSFAETLLSFIQKQ